MLVTEASFVGANFAQGASAVVAGVSILGGGRRGSAFELLPGQPTNAPHGPSRVTFRDCEVCQSRPTALATREKDDHFDALIESKWAPTPS